MDQNTDDLKNQDSNIDSETAEKPAQQSEQLEFDQITKQLDEYKSRSAKLSAELEKIEKEKKQNTERKRKDLQAEKKYEDLVNLYETENSELKRQISELESQFSEINIYKSKTEKLTDSIKKMVNSQLNSFSKDERTKIKSLSSWTDDPSDQMRAISDYIALVGSNRSVTTVHGSSAESQSDVSKKSYADALKTGDPKAISEALFKSVLN